MLTEPGEKSQSGKLWSRDEFAEDRALCIDFANTLSWRGRDTPAEGLPEPGSWLKWVREHKLMDDSDLAELKRRAELWPSELEGAHKRAVEYREALYNLLTAFSLRKGPTGIDESTVQDVLDRALEGLKLETGSRPWQWRLETTGVEWDAALFPIALSAAQLLTSGWADRLHICEREECQWLFLDLTKNHSKKWCSMETCGNVVKARRHYAKKKGG